MKVEVEAREIALKNSHGDIAIIPVKDVAWVKEKLGQGCHSCLDEYIDTLPMGKDYAEDGTVDPGDGWLNSVKNTIISKQRNQQIDVALASKDYDKTARLLGDTATKELPLPTYEDQRAWMKSYIQSPMYREILTQEFSKSGKAEGVDKEIQRRLKNVSNTPIQEVQIDPRGYGYARGEFLAPSVNKNEINLDSGTPAKSYTSGKISIDPSAKFIDSHVGLHELTHASTNNNAQLTKYARTKIGESVNKDRNSKWKDLETGNTYGYYDDPTEVHARLTTLKFLMNRYGIYDPGKEKATPEHIKKAFSNPNIQKLIDVKDLRKMLHGKGDLTELLNTIAFIDDNETFV